jgi:hypothetical protein
LAIETWPDQSQFIGEFARGKKSGNGVRARVARVRRARWVVGWKNDRKTIGKGWNIVTEPYFTEKKWRIS